MYSPSTSSHDHPHIFDHPLLTHSIWYGNEAEVTINFMSWSSLIHCITSWRELLPITHGLFFSLTTSFRLNPWRRDEELSGDIFEEGLFAHIDASSCGFSTDLTALGKSTFLDWFNSSKHPFKKFVEANTFFLGDGGDHSNDDKKTSPQFVGGVSVTIRSTDDCIIQMKLPWIFEQSGALKFRVRIACFHSHWDGEPTALEENEVCEGQLEMSLLRQ